MIQPDRAFREIVRLTGTGGIAGTLLDGETVRVEVLGGSSPGRVRIRLAGSVVSASDIRGVSPGDVFRARVRLTSGAVLLTPLTDDPPVAPRDDSPFLRLGLPETPINAQIIAFFRSINARLDPALVRGIASLAARFPGREARAAEAAAILAERGIEPDEESVARLLSCMEGASALADGEGSDGKGSGDSAGENGERSGKSRRFLSFINAKKGSDLHWVVVPFAVTLAERACRGSVRFLLDLAQGTVTQTRVTCLDGKRTWDFELSGASCAFGAVPGFDGVHSERIRVYLLKALERAGIRAVTEWASRGQGGELPKVDVRA
ncbi:MAG TPA: hypothetical protein PKL75_10010 [Treponemataceae bacterium]|nr:hypothetical protein [Treponemataceae bacterium]